MSSPPPSHAKGLDFLANSPAGILSAAPGPTASLSGILAFQATVPEQDLSNPLIQNLLRQESSTALGGYWQNTEYYSNGTSSGDSIVSAQGGPSSGPPIPLYAEAKWVSTAATASLNSPATDGGVTLDDVGVVIGIVGVCTLAGSVDLATDGFAEWAGSGAACISAIIGGRDALADVASQMYNTLQSVWTISSQDPAQQSDTADETMAAGNSLLPGGYGDASETISFSGDGSVTSSFDDTNYSGDWGNGNYFTETAGGDPGFGFQGGFMQAGFGGDNSSVAAGIVPGQLASDIIPRLVPSLGFEGMAATTLYAAHSVTQSVEFPGSMVPHAMVSSHSAVPFSVVLPHGL